MKNKLCTPLVLLLIFLISCQKELRTTSSTPSTPSNPSTDTPQISNGITGTWKFMSLEAETQSTSEPTTSGTSFKLFTQLNYKTINNDGIIEISDSEMVCKGITYNIYATLENYKYRNDVLVDSFETPFINAFPPTDSYTPYELVANDSIFFKKGGFSDFSASRFSVRAPAAKLELTDNVLKFIQPIYKDKFETLYGKRYHTVVSGEVIMTLYRQ